MKHVVILGAGTGGTMLANKLRKQLDPAQAQITVVDKDDTHVYQPGLLFVPFGIESADEITRSRAAQLRDGVRFVRAAVDSVEIATNTVRLTDADDLAYDVLIIATGAQLLFDETEGLLDAGWQASVFDFYTVDGAAKLAGALEQFTSGHLVVAVMDTPIKCPVAPLEFAFLADWYFHEAGVRDQIKITYVTPLDGAFTRPVASEQLQHLLDDKEIHMATDFVTGRVDGANKQLISWDERTIDFDLAVVVPIHGGADYVARSEGLGDVLDWVEVDIHTLQSNAAPNIFAIGDAATLPTSKAGSVAHFEAEVLVDNVLSYLDGKPLTASYDGHANCFVETGFKKGLLIDFNYEQEPVTGHFPFPGVGPLSLLEESRLNHISKMVFGKIYWTWLLQGKHIPGVPSKMRMAGKEVSS